MGLVLTPFTCAMRLGRLHRWLPRSGTHDPDQRQEEVPQIPPELHDRRSSQSDAAATIATTSSERLTSQYVPPTPSSAPVDDTAAAASSAHTNTRAPSARKRRAVASPMPLVPPVTSTPSPASPALRQIPGEQAGTEAGGAVAQRGRRD
jgi:hypothetical protein